MTPSKPKVLKLQILPLASGFLLGLGCVYPDSFWGILSALLSITSFWYFFSTEGKSKRSFFLIGVAFHATSMWWLGGTMERFGGFHWSIAYLLLVLYCLASSLQFLFAAWLGEALRKRLLIESETVSLYSLLPLTLSWMLFEIIFPRLFPWGLGDFFISASFFSSYAELFGSRGLSLFVLFVTYILYTLFSCVLKKQKNESSSCKIVSTSFLKLSLTAIVLLFAGGWYLDHSAKTQEAKAPKTTALLVQGNLDIHEKGAMSYLEANLERYRELSLKGITESSSQANSEVEFVIWPETVMNRWTPLMYSEYLDESIDPFPKLEIPLLYGTLAYFLEAGRPRSEASILNAAVLRDSKGSIASFYAKRILMPFGEYVPFGDTFPWIRSLVPLHSEFSRGTVESPLEIKTKSETVYAGILICYEDLVSSISRSYGRQNANVLINLTNDAWYGDTSAPYQHDLLARYRAIETRKALIRSTNTGFTTLVSSRGEILASLPLFEEAYQNISFPLLEKETFYAAVGDYPLYGVLSLLFVFMFVGGRRKAK